MKRFKYNPSRIVSTGVTARCAEVASDAGEIVAILSPLTVADAMGKLGEKIAGGKSGSEDNLTLGYATNLIALPKHLLPPGCDSMVATVVTTVRVTMADAIESLRPSNAKKPEEAFAAV